jgi:hypothetical protein
MSVALALILLHLGYPLADAITLSLGHGRENRENQLTDAVAGHVPAQVDHVQADVATLNEDDLKKAAPAASTVSTTRLRSRKSFRCSQLVSDTNTQPWQAAPWRGRSAFPSSGS